MTTVRPAASQSRISPIVCTGTASDSASLLRMLEKLQALPAVSALHSEQIRGKSPLQFQVNFRWEEAGQP